MPVCFCFGPFAPGNIRWNPNRPGAAQQPSAPFGLFCCDVALNDAEIAELKSVLKSRLGKEPRLHTKIDPALLGGLVVKLGSRMIDSSIRTKLAGIRTAMRGN